VPTTYVANIRLRFLNRSPKLVGTLPPSLSVEIEGQRYDVDTGFIVYNDWTYPNFIALMNEIGVSGRKSEMSFSVTCETTGLEYAGRPVLLENAQRHCAL